MIIKEVKPTISNFKIVGGAECWKEVVESARLSGVPESVSDEKVFKMIVVNQYLSATEHICIKFDVVMSKGVAPEFLEHRIGISHSGFSTRYSKVEKDDVYEIIVPFHILKENNELVKSIFMRGVEEAFDSYKDLLNETDKSCPREIARYVLPFCSATGRYHITMNLRSLLNFLSLRLCARASHEMRCLASQLYFELIKVLPMIRDFIGCRGITNSVCPENEVTGFRIGEPLKYQPTCPFRYEESLCYIPTMFMQKTVGGIENITIVKERLYEQWAKWEN
jgi:thymidylate synthase (FAD)